MKLKLILEEDGQYTVCDRSCYLRDPECPPVNRPARGH